MVGIPPLHRLALLVVARPKWYLDLDHDWSDFDLERWSYAEYQYEPDPLGGAADFLTPPAEMLEDPAGDCEDYAMVAASYLYAETDHDLSIVWLYRWPPRIRGPSAHLIAYDATEQIVYSNGRVLHLSLSEYEEERPYVGHIERPLR